MTGPAIRSCLASDADDICAIYNHYVRDSIATFEVEPVSRSEMANRIGRVTQSFPWLVSAEQDRVNGYAYAAPWNTRTAYRYSVESTVYVAPDSTRRGIGSRLLGALLADLAGHDVHCVLAGISLPNDASVGVHERHGFVKVGHVREVGRKFDRWIDVGYWQLTLTAS